MVKINADSDGEICTVPLHWWSVNKTFIYIDGQCKGAPFGDQLNAFLHWWSLQKGSLRLMISKRSNSLHLWSLGELVKVP